MVDGLVCCDMMGVLVFFWFFLMKIGFVLVLCDVCVLLYIVYLYSCGWCYVCIFYYF